MSDATREFLYRINGKQATTDDGTPESAKLLTDAGFEPADDYLLIQRTPHGSRVITSDDVLDLSGGDAEFYAFESGTAFEFTVNEHTVFWGADKIRCREAKHLAHIPTADDLVWIRDESTNMVLGDEDFLELKAAGVEHFRSHKRPTGPVVYKYFVNGTEYTTELPEVTGAQVTARIPGWNPANSLVLESDGSAPDEVVHPNTVVVLKGRTNPAHFTIVPPATFGGR